MIGSCAELQAPWVVKARASEAVRCKRKLILDIATFEVNRGRKKSVCGIVYSSETCIQGKSEQVGS